MHKGLNLQQLHEVKIYFMFTLCVVHAIYCADCSTWSVYIENFKLLFFFHHDFLGHFLSSIGSAIISHEHRQSFSSSLTLIHYTY